MAHADELKIAAIANLINEHGITPRDPNWVVLSIRGILDIEVAEGDVEIVVCDHRKLPTIGPESVLRDLINADASKQKVEDAQVERRVATGLPEGVDWADRKSVRMWSGNEGR